jgi:protein tyrosine/serine phosphatase
MAAWPPALQARRAPGNILKLRRPVAPRGLAGAMNHSTQTTAQKRSKLRLRLIIAGVVLALCTAFGLANSKIYLFYSNFHTVVEKQVYRSARPNPERIQHWFDRYGIATVIDMECGDQSDEPKMKELGIVELDIRWPSSRLPPTEKLRGLITAIETCRRPLLIHCRAGAERTGVASVIAAMAVGNKSYEAARQQLSSEYLHLWHDPDRAEGVVDEYEDYCRTHRLATGGWKEFRAWAMTVYDQPGDSAPSNSELRHQAASN